MIVTGRILVVEDDATLRRVLGDNLEMAGHTVETARDGQVALRLVESFQPELVVLDVMLPFVNGLEVCRRLRAAGNDVPIVMLTARDAGDEVVQGLDVGADDYVTKPFEMAELMARVRATLRRRTGSLPVKLRFGAFVLDVDAHRLTRDGAVVDVTPKEFALLEHLLRHAGRAMSRQELLQACWGSARRITARSVDRCVTTLRSKVEDDPRRPRWIRTVRDVGYRLEKENERAIEDRA